MSGVIIPYSPRFSLLSQERQHKLAFNTNRREMVKQIRCIEALRHVAEKLNQRDSYRLVFKPEGAKLHKDSAGYIKGVFYKDGKIIEHARFERISPYCVKAIKTISSQVLLISIAIQVADIRKAITKISIELHDDRIAEIESGRNQLEQAVLVEDKIRREGMFLHAIQTLNTGLEKTVRSLRRQIGDLPTARSGLLDNWGLSSKAKEAKEKMRVASESFEWALMGIQLLSESYAFLGEPQVAEKTLRDGLSKITNCDIRKAAERARIVPNEGNVLPERQWELFLKEEKEFISHLDECCEISDNAVPNVEIELKPNELLSDRTDSEERS